MADWLGSLLGAVGKVADFSFGKSQANKERDRQDSAIQRRVADAKAAGIHPLYALGANVSSPSVTVGSDFGSMGQDIGRAVAATRTADDRLKSLTLTNMELRNKLLEGQISKINQSQLGPSVPLSTQDMQPVVSGQGDVMERSIPTPLFTHDPSVQLVSGPESKVQAQKSFGYTLIPNLKRFSPSQQFQNVYGEEGLPAFIHNAASWLDSLYRGFTRYHSPRFEERRRRWHGG